MSDLYRRAALQFLLSMPPEIRQEYEGLVEEFCRRLMISGTRLDPGGNWSGNFPGGGGGGTGDVLGPASSVANNLAAFLDATGKILSDSGIPLTDVARLSLANVFTQNQQIAKATPGLVFDNTGQAANQRDVVLRINGASGTDFQIVALNDDGSVQNVMASFSRAGDFTIPGIITSAGGGGGGEGGVVTIPGGGLAGQPVGLGPEDVGALYMVTSPYNHMVRWDGLKWTFAPGDMGNGQISMRAFAPQEPGWQLCDGTSTDYLVVGGPTLVTGAFVTPNLTSNAVYAKSAAAYNPTVVPGSGATSGAGVLTTSVGGPTATDAGGPGATAGSGVLYAASGAAGAHSHGGVTADSGNHAHGGATAEAGVHQHHIPGFSVGTDQGGPVQNTDAGSSYFAARGDHTHNVNIPGHYTDFDGNHAHSILTDEAPRHAHGITGEGDHAHTSVTPDHAHGIAPHAHTLAAHQHTVPDHTHTIGTFDVPHISVLMYFRR